MNTMNIHSISIMYTMNSMNYKTSKTSGFTEYYSKLLEKIDITRSDKYVASSNLSM